MKDGAKVAEEGNEEKVSTKDLEKARVEEGASDEVNADPIEEPPVQILRDPGCPTLEERDRHECTHMPYRAWCPVCVEAKGREDKQLKMTVKTRPLS